MERKNIAAFTESTSDSYPAYLSINFERDGKFTITARERGYPDHHVTIEIPENDLEQIGFNIVDRLQRFRDAKRAG